MKKLISAMLSLALLIFAGSALSACGSEKPTIGIIQFGSHGSLNNCYTGIIEGLKETVDLSAYKIEYVNSNFDPSVSLAQAQKLVNKRAKVIIAIATPSAIQAATAAVGTGIPTVYCAVTDASQVANFADLTGTSDIPDFDAQLALVTAFMGKSGVTIGILSSTEESSDGAQITAIKKAAENYPGMRILTETVADISTIDVKTDALIAAGADCFVNLLDNTVVGRLQNILVKTNAANIPVFGSEIEQVRAGCLASASIDYITGGKLSRRQAAEIQAGKPVREVEKKTMENQTYPYYNSKVLAKFPALSLPQGIAGLSDVAK